MSKPAPYEQTAEGILLFGKPAAYWLELQRRATELNVDHLVMDLTVALAKVAYYEQKFQEIEQFMKIQSPNRLEYRA